MTPDDDELVTTDEPQHVTVRIYHVILSTESGDVHELDLQAPDAGWAAQLAVTHLPRTDDGTPDPVTNLHVRRLDDT